MSSGPREPAAGSESGLSDPEYPTDSDTDSCGRRTHWHTAGLWTAGAYAQVLFDLLPHPFAPNKLWP